LDDVDDVDDDGGVAMYVALPRWIQTRGILKVDYLDSKAQQKQNNHVICRPFKPFVAMKQQHNRVSSRAPTCFSLNSINTRQQDRTLDTM